LKKLLIIFEHEENEVIVGGFGGERAEQGEDVLGDAGFAALDDRSGETDFHAALKSK
jgi:hypothetical protein